MSEDKIEEEHWEELKSRLPLRNHDPVPEGYFDEMPDQMVSLWKEEQQKKHQKRFVLRKWISIAAISTGIFLGGWWWINQDSIEGAITSYSSADAYQYVLENIDEFSALMENQIPGHMQDEIQLPPDSAVEEYLLEELEGHDLEQLF